ncbi:MAG TPA: hypothetical protein VKR52_10165 [Terracidiphilus sp.]|nr:hypothetical protein [Terracidiphilus sp.]
MADVKVIGGGALKGSYRLTKDKVLGLQNMLQGSQQLLMEWLVLALQVEHGYGLGG